ncbi:GTPase-activating protein [Pichia californica]|uniref:GTPase-activating protein n=1 Tax=Pichia californica TaxID=460514 RepID=A0A9P7BHU8_9ASCO|nr:GTPase-activating protein [[Candida] californica]
MSATAKLQEFINSNDYVFDNDPFDFDSNIQTDDSPISTNQNQNSIKSTNKNHDLNISPNIQQSKNFFKSLSSLTHNELSPSKQSAALKARLVNDQQQQQQQQPGIHSRSFFDSVKEHSKVRSMSPSRRSTSSSRSKRSSSSLSISRTHSNTLSKFGLTNKSNKRESESPFDDSDDDWNDTLDEFKDLKTVNNGLPSNLNFEKLSINDSLNNNNNNNISLSSSSILLNENKKITEETDEIYPFLKKNYQDIMKDPYSILSLQTPLSDDIIKYNKIVKALTKSNFEISELKKQSWSGIPSSLRSLVWQILVGYLPTNTNTRTSVLNRKRKDYINSITRLFRSDKDQSLWHQIKIDVLRTNPSIKLYSFETTHRSLEKILYLWSIRHPASGYVQGINDLVTPFFQVFLNHYLSINININEFDPKCLPKELLNIIEADTYWCLTKVLDTIQDNFIHEQPGIIRQITELKNLIKRDEPLLALHFENENLDFIQFAFRWMNCMLMREFKLNLIIRMWDTYLSDFPTGFSQFHIYVCCAFLRRFSDYLMEMEFQDIIMFLQDTSKTLDWTEDDIEMMLSEAYVWQSLYENAAAHLK